MDCVQVKIGYLEVLEVFNGLCTGDNRLLILYMIMVTWSTPGIPPTYVERSRPSRGKSTL